MSTELAIYKRNDFLAISDNEQAQAMMANTEGETLGFGDLRFIKTPAGGGTIWSIPTVTGEENAKSIDGVLVAIGKRRTLWGSDEPTGEPPICQSCDLVNGQCLVPAEDLPENLFSLLEAIKEKAPKNSDAPGGACAKCAFAQWGTAVKQGGKRGRGQRCRESRMLFVLRPGDMLPLVVPAQVGSLKQIKQFLFGLKVPHWQAVISLSLEKTANKDNIAFSRIVPRMIGTVDDPEAIKIIRERYTTPLKAIMDQIQLPQDNYGESDDE